MKKKILIKKISIALMLITYVSCDNLPLKEKIAQDFPVKAKYNLIEMTYFEADEIKNPVEMMAHNQQIFFKNFRGPHFITVFNAKTRRFITDIAPQGMGPEEFVFVNSLTGKKGGISFYDCNLRKVFYAESKIGDYSDITYKSLPVLPDTSFFCNHSYIYPIGDSNYYSMGIFEENRFVLLDSTGTTIAPFGNYPDIKEHHKFSNIALGMGNQGFTSCNSTGEYMAVANYVGGIIQFYDLRNPEKPVLAKEKIYAPSYFVDNTTQTSWGITFLKEKNIAGALSLQYYKDYVCVLFSGTDHSEKSHDSNILLIFSPLGEPLQFIELNKKCALFAIDESDGIAYFLVSNEGDNYKLYEFNLNQIIK